ncbi:hypothetical protein M758_3G253000 [Ceratodon purpureus]|nr:hypothetical protein M758_3G253000 [Ceratodon purpureus]
MGNAAMVCGGRGERAAVTVLQADGNVLSLYSRVRVVDLILDYPNHFVCHSSSLVLLQHGKILPLHTLLVPGEVYFLLPMPGVDHSHEDEEESDMSSLLRIEPPRRAVHRTGSMKFVISTEQFSKIMAGSIKEGRHSGSSGVHQSSSVRKRAVRSNKVQKTPQPWRPALSSIEEVAAN